MTRADDLRRDDPHFVDRLRESVSHVEQVAAWLRRWYAVEIPATRIRPTEEDRADYFDSGDVIIRGADGIPLRIEIKKRGFEFTTDRYPYPTIMLCEVPTYDRADPKPHAYIHTNRDVTVAAIVVCAPTLLHWRRVTRFDRQKNRPATNYECPVGLATFREIT